MAQNFVVVAACVCVLAAVVQSAPQQYHQNPFLQPQQQNQFQRQQFQPQPQPQNTHEPERQSRFHVIEDNFHQNPETKEYNFE